MKSKDQHLLEEAYTSIFAKTVEKILIEADASQPGQGLTAGVLLQKLQAAMDQLDECSVVYYDRQGFECPVVGLRAIKSHLALITDDDELESLDGKSVYVKLNKLMNVGKITPESKVIFAAQAESPKAMQATSVDHDGDSFVIR